jgi:hypothetical protein
MAVKTFAVGEVLTASDTNTYLNNGGLVYITSFTVPASPASTTVVCSNVFSSTYDTYRVVVTGIKASTANTSFRLTMGSTTTGYYQNGYYQTYASATLNGNPANNSLTYWEISFVEDSSATPYSVEFDIAAPNLANKTRLHCLWATSSYVGVTNGVLADSTQYTAFTLSAQGGGGTGTLNSGTITVYGYRKA